MSVLPLLRLFVTELLIIVEHAVAAFSWDSREKNEVPPLAAIGTMKFTVPVS
jgi:hypothetical protein